MKPESDPVQGVRFDSNLFELGTENKRACAMIGRVALREHCN